MAGTSDTSRNREAFAGSSGPFGCTGQPRWAQWFEMIVKLGWSFSWPLYRMNAVRLDTVPWDASAVYVVTMNFPSGYCEIGPRLWSFRPCLRNEGATAKPSTGAVIRPPMTAPTPIVAPSRNRERG